MRDIEEAYFVRTDNIHPISESLKIKVGASYRLRMDGNNNTDISNNLYVMENVFK
jgi:energy-converting hydrogenase A subunit M